MWNASKEVLREKFITVNAYIRKDNNLIFHLKTKQNWSNRSKLNCDKQKQTTRTTKAGRIGTKNGKSIRKLIKLINT